MHFFRNLQKINESAPKATTSRLLKNINAKSYEVRNLKIANFKKKMKIKIFTTQHHIVV
jgi:hypothetical protein